MNHMSKRFLSGVFQGSASVQGQTENLGLWDKLPGLSWESLESMEYEVSIKSPKPMPDLSSVESLENLKKRFSITAMIMNL